MIVLVSAKRRSPMAGETVFPCSEAGTATSGALVARADAIRCQRPGMRSS
jgi:hypothetical protein